MPNVRRSYSLLPTILVSLLLPAASHADGLLTVEQGTWDIGRAAIGSTVAADSAATAYFNPAGMSLFTEPEVTGGVMAILGETRFDANSRTTISGGTGGNQTGNAVVPSGPFAVYPINEDWAIGFSVTAPFVGTLDPDDSWPGRYQLTKLDLQVLRFGPSVSYRVNEWLSIGGTVAMNRKSKEDRVLAAARLGLQVQARASDAWNVQATRKSENWAELRERAALRVSSGIALGPIDPPCVP